MALELDMSSVDHERAKHFAEVANDAIKNKKFTKAWSTSESIAGALILGEPELLQGTYKDPITAIERLEQGGEGSLNDVLYVREKGVASVLSGA